MAFYQSSTGLSRGLFGATILLFSFALSVASSPVPESPFHKFAKALIPRDILDNGNSTDSLITLEPRTYRLTLPYWTQIPTTVLDFLLAFWTVSFAWEKRGEGEKPAGKFWIAVKLTSFLYLFIQSVSGLIHLAMNAHGDGLSVVQRPGGNNFVALFAASTQLWHKTVLEHPRTLLIGAYINLSLALLYLILLSLPVVGSGPIFQAWSPGCSFLVNSDNGTGWWDASCSTFDWQNTTGDVEYVGSEFTCATAYDLGLGGNGSSSQKIQSYFSWFFVFFIFLLLIGSVTTYFSNPIKRNEHRALRYCGPIMRWTIMMSAIYAAAYIGLAWLYQSEEFKASIVVCPNIVNSTLGAVALNNETCTCVDIQRPFVLPIQTVLDGDKSALSRLISNF
ncbi:hypothetical protein EG329_004170 [Mollisiaceae sp. DMI_Dod_QoI]|nr:hypothetical protein EG329_004170 [Helotiales sp. DMI_Dod_QoI]